MTELEQKIQQAGVERERRYPLLAIVDNREEIRKIAQQTQDYMVELNPDVKRIKIWEAIPRIVIEFISASFTKLSKTDAVEKGSSSIIIGDIMELGVNGIATKDGDKDGNLTPFIRCRSEFKYENVSLPYMDEVPIDIAKEMREEKCEGLPIQFFDNREEIKEISKLQSEIMGIINKKSALSNEAKDKVAKTCKAADVNANGDPRLIEALEVLKTLKKNLMAIRK